MFEYTAPSFDGIFAINIAMPASTGAAVKLIDLIAAGTVLTPAADYNANLTGANPRGLSATVDNLVVTGSSPLTRFWAEHTARAVIENHSATFVSGWESTASLGVTRAVGTPYVTNAGLDGARRAYLISSGSTFTCTVICHIRLQGTVTL
jgi:hypothetical protein